MMVDHLVASGESILAVAWPCVLPVRLSGRHHKALAVFFPAQVGRLIKRLVISERCITNARQLVGQRTCSFVVVTATLHL